MSTGDPSTIHVVTGDGVAMEAAALDSGVPGLVLAATPGADRWRLIHSASGRIVSRSAQHSDPEILRKLAHRLASFTDWTEKAIRLPGPVLRREIEEAAQQLGLTPDGHENSAPSSASAAPTASTDPAGFPSAQATGEVPAPGGAKTPAGAKTDGPSVSPRRHDQVEELKSRLRSTERERALLRRILRRVHTAVPPGTFADAIRDLDGEERALLVTLITDGASDSTAVVRSLPVGGGIETPASTASSSPSAPSASSRPNADGDPGSNADTGVAAS